MGSNDNLDLSVDMNYIEKPLEPNGNELENEKVKEKSKSKSDKRSERSSSSRRSDASYEKLCSIMQNGFGDLQTSLGNMGEDIAQKVTNNMKGNQEFIPDEVSVEDNVDLHVEDVESDEAFEVESNIFDKLSKDYETNEAAGPSVSFEIAKLVNTMLSVSANETVAKSRADRHPRPKNLTFAEAPKVNKPVWDSMKTKVRAADSQLQDIQKDLLKSTVPMVKVIEVLNEAREKNVSIDLSELITNLSDAVAFVGSANVKLVKRRREFIKDDTSEKIKGICNAEVPFSGSLLFGDNLVQKMKEVSENDKISEELRKQNTGKTFPYRGRGSLPNFKNYSTRSRGAATYSNYSTRFNRGRYSPYAYNANRRGNSYRPSANRGKEAAKK